MAALPVAGHASFGATIVVVVVGGAKSWVVVVSPG